MGKQKLPEAQKVPPTPKRTDILTAESNPIMNSPLGYRMKHSPLNDNGDDVSSSGGLTEEQKAIIAAHRLTESDPTLPNWEKDISDKQILQIDSLKTGKGKYADMSFQETYPLQKDIIREVWYKSMDKDKGIKPPSWINK